MGNIIDQLRGHLAIPFATFALGVGLGAMGSLFPYFLTPLGIDCFIIAASYAVIDCYKGPAWRSVYFYLIFAVCIIVGVLAWFEYFQPKQEEAENQAARALLLTATSRCTSDLGRQAAIKRLAKYSKELIGADLDCARLDHMELPAGTDLHSAKLMRAQAHHSFFSGVNFTGAILSQGNFQETDFTDANFEGAILGALVVPIPERRCYQGANLKDAILIRANLRGAFLDGVTGVTCGQLKLANNWSEAFRDKSLSCGMPVPIPPKDSQTTKGCDMK